MECVDLSYHFALPQNTFSCPKFIASEITKEIEYVACTEFYESLFDYAYFKICQKLNLKHRNIEWASDLNNSNKILTVTNFNINDNFVKIGDLYKNNVISNYIEVEFHLLLIELLGGNIFDEENFGIIEDDIFYKMFNYNTFFEFEASVEFSSNLTKDTKDFFTRDAISILNQIDKELLLFLKPMIDDFCNITIKEFYILFDYPDTPKFDKGKKWIVDKCVSIQKEIKKFF